MVPKLLTRPSLVQIMACRLFGAKPLFGPMIVSLLIVLLRDGFQWISNPNTTNAIHENEFGIVVCKMLITPCLWVDQHLPILYNGCNYLSILGLNLNHVNKRGPRWHVEDAVLRNSTPQDNSFGLGITGDGLKIYWYFLPIWGWNFSRAATT